MTDQVDCFDKHLRYSAVDLYFIYSFVVDFPNSSFEGFICANKDDWRQDQLGSETPVNWRMYPSEPVGRRGVAPLVDVKAVSQDPAGPKCYFPTAVWNIQKAQCVRLQYTPTVGSEACPTEFDVSCESVVRLWRNGAGTVTFKLSLSDESSLNRPECGWKRIKQISALTRKSYTPVGIAVLDGIPLYEHVRRRIAGIIRKKKGVNLLCEMISDCEYPSFGDNHEAAMNGLSPQNPHVFTVITLKDSGNDQPPFWNSNGVSNGISPTALTRHRELASLVLDIIPEDNPEIPLQKQLDRVVIPERLRTTSGGMRSFAWDTRLFIACNSNNVLLAKYENRQPSYSFIEFSVLDALEVIRTRWYMSVIINVMLDADLDLEKSTDAEDYLQSLRRRIRRRKQFGYFLNDPLTYRYVGGAVTDVVVHLERELRLKTLREMTVRKFEMLDALFRDKRLLMEFEQYEAYRKAAETINGRG